MELKRRLYTRGSSYETTIPRPLLFSRDLSKKQVVKFVYDEEKGRWYIEFEERDVRSGERRHLEFEEFEAASNRRGDVEFEKSGRKERAASGVPEFEEFHARRRMHDEGEDE